MKILSDEQRARLLNEIAKASDQLLLDAVEVAMQEREKVQEDWDKLPLEFKTGVVFATNKPPVAALNTDKDGFVVTPEEKAAVAKAKPIQVPPGEACSRVGNDTKVAILRIIKDAPADLAHINKGLKRGDGQRDATQSILKLLWTRGDVTYSDGLYSSAS